MRSFHRCFVIVSFFVVVGSSSALADPEVGRRGTLQCAVDAPTQDGAKPSESVLCVYNVSGEPVTMYQGKAGDPEIDMGEIRGDVMRWIVVAVPDADRRLAGDYTAMPAPADLHLPSHTKVLAKRDDTNTVLQPDVDPGDGVLNFAVGIKSLTLVGY